MVKVTDDNNCFACGEMNPHGLHLSFEYSDDGEAAWTYFEPQKSHEGWSGITHGGIMAVVLDEVAAKVVHHLGINSVTARLDVRYIQPARTCELHKISARLVRQRGRLVEVKAEARREDGTLVTSATAVMFKVE
ncbi:MAG: PaaI family thioesterase [Candidatus Coatesbacteria bacterium]|nr:PaaI family thioesterase [Candidatus Coatesbacteria bacterium]